MTDLKSPRAIIAKGFLFLFCGILAAGMILLESPSWRMAMLLCITVWGFSRFYYFAFYVIEHYVNDGYRFAGLWSFARYLWKRTLRRRA